jgi:hypothetical protein
MIFRHFANDRNENHSYLIASCSDRSAAIVNPVSDSIDDYLTTIEELGLRLEYTLETSNGVAGRAAARELTKRAGSKRVAPVPAAALTTVSDDSVAVEGKPGEQVRVGDLKIELIRALDGSDSVVAYRVLDYTFADRSVLIDYHASTDLSDGEPESLFEHIRPPTANVIMADDRAPIRSFRSSRREVEIERLILEDLHMSLAERRFTPKEERVILSYVRHLEDNGFVHPSATDLAKSLGNVDRTAIHVLIHNIRWKQIDRDRMPVVLAGQTSKWLRGLQTKPDYTSHEKEFLVAYLRLLEQNQQPPSGPQIADELDADRSVQWVRKRAHTIRRKQRAFRQPVLLLARKGNDPSGGLSFRRSHEGEIQLTKYA